MFKEEIDAEYDKQLNLFIEENQEIEEMSKIGIQLKNLH